MCDGYLVAYFYLRQVGYVYDLVGWFVFCQEGNSKSV